MINEETVVIGNSYIVIGLPISHRLNESIKLMGKVGKAKWANYRGICLKFPDNTAYVLPFNCVKDITPTKQFRKIPTAENAITDQYRYRLSKLPSGDPPIQLLGKVGMVCQINWAANSGICQINFPDEESSITYLECLEDIGG